ncbi:MAG: glutathione peroxidase [Lentisphaeria bacterium]|nr:glutathione peroxidase [Lentisphaeria bacterium]
MRWHRTWLVALAAAGACGAEQARGVYDFTVKAADGSDVSLRTYEGKVLLIVNVASRCGYTKQYAGLEKLYATYADRGLVILGFPCNQFGKQEPGSNEEIQTFCSVNYGVTFPVMAKIEVNGPGADPLYGYLKANAPGILGSEAIKWNFTKFLVDRNGKVIGRYGSSKTPESLAQTIADLLGGK